MSSVLAKEILQLARSLGAKVSEAKRKQDLPSYVSDFASFSWPKRHCFRTDGYSDPERTSITFSRIEKVPDEYYDLKGDEYWAFGIHNGGNWILVFRGEDRDPANPTVYELDHEPEGSPEPLCRLKEFFSCLIPES